MITIEGIARVCHETNRAFCQAIGDDSQKPWDEAERWQRDSAIAGVKWRLNDISAPYSEQHDEWVTAKLLAGWVYGPIKDAEAKTHPCMVVYEQLPMEQKVKDMLFVRVVKSMRYLLPVVDGSYVIPPADDSD